MKRWTAEETQFLLDNYQQMTMVELSTALSRTMSSVRGKKEELGGLSKQYHQNLWTPEQIQQLKEFYAVAGTAAPLNLKRFAESIGKHNTNVCRKARELGLPTNQKRPTHPEADKHRPQWGVDHPHPKGFLGRKHTPETLAILSEKSKLQRGIPKNLTPEQRMAISLRAIELNKSGNGYSRTKKGWLEVGGKKYFYKSAWEMSYANYLQFLKQAKQIVDWEYEVDTFWFEKIRRGVRSYTPDFKVFYPDGSIEYHEVKGWMDAKSKTKLKRMKIYYPEIKLILVDQVQFKALKRQLPRVFEAVRV